MTPPEPQVAWERVGTILRLTINRPASANALNTAVSWTGWSQASLKRLVTMTLAR
jgi:hypothetical protein